MIGVVFALSLLLFFWLRALPGGVVSALLGERATPASRAALTEAFGLDQPVYVQYLKVLQRAARGEFGVSTAVLPGQDAFHIFLVRLPATIELTTSDVESPWSSRRAWEGSCCPSPSIWTPAS